MAYVENSDSQFNAGSYNSTYLSGTGSSVALGLDYYGSGAGYSVPGSDEWFNGSWKYRQPVLVTSANSASLSNYAVPVTVNTQALISAGRMNADGSDLRFTTAAAAGSAPALGYYIESGLNTAATKIWVKASALNPGSNTLYMYYGYTAAPAASGMAAAFVMGNDFNAANGTVPSSATWVNIESAVPLAGSVRDIQANSLRVRFGSLLGQRYYGLRSSSQYSFASPRRYHAEVGARASGSDSWSYVTLCPSIYTYSSDQDEWLRFSVKHSASGPTYTVERSEYGIKSTLVSAAPLGAGFHAVDFLISSSTFKVMLDGAQVYSAPNTLNFNSPYIYLEGASSAASYDDFLFDNVYVTPYASPEPAFDSAGQAQGRRYPAGTFTSQARDTGGMGTRVQNVNWASVISTGSSLGVELRAHDTNVALATFTAAGKGADPLVAGRYVQYRLALDTADPRFTSTLSSITLSYVSPPSTPTSPGGQAIDSWTMKWYWTDASAGQYQEEGFKVADTSGAVRGSLAAGATYWVEAGLNPNTPYTRAIYGYNAAGNGNPATITKYTLPAPPSAACDKSTGTWLSGTLTCSNLAGFGANGVTYYRYAWTSSAVYPAWLGTEAQWTSGSLPFAPSSSGEYYLHLKSYNADGATLADDRTFGPYWYDKLAPVITGFSPSSSPWTNDAGILVQVSVSDAGGSLLKQGRYKWTTTSDRPGSAWLPFLGSPIINTSSSAVTITAPASGGQWYLHVETDDQAGNVGYAYTGVYKLDMTQPTGGVTINGGDIYTPSRDVTLTLAYSDSDSGVKSLAYRNLGVAGGFSAAGLPQATTTWTLSPGGDQTTKTVLMEVTDNAGNVKTSPAYPSDTITLDSRTSLFGDSLSQKASGVMGEAAETFAAGAHLSWTPTGAPLNGKSITFIFAGSTKTALTDSLGQASTSFFVPAASGTYTYAVSFSTDGVYSESSSTGVITATQRPTSIITEDINSTANAGFTAKATLKDNFTDKLITGAVVNFLFEGVAHQAVTNSSGVATVSYTAPGVVGFYDYTASYDGGPVYGQKSAASRVGVGLRVTSLVVPGVTALAQDAFNAQATLLDGGTPVPGATISFDFQGLPAQTAVTDASGIAVTSFNAPASSGTYPYAASYAGDGTYTASSGGANLTVSRRPLSLSGEAGIGYVNAAFQARATLADLGVGVAGKTVAFFFEASSATAVTDATGAAAVVFNTGALPRASSCYYSFAGDAGYGVADSTKTVSINRRPAALSASDASALINSSFTAIASLKDIAFTALEIPGKTITFNFRGEVKTGVTDSLGIASVTYQTGISTGSYSFYTTFDQDGAYLAAEDTGTVTLGKRPSVVSAYPKFVFSLDSITAVADLKDGVTGELIGGQPITFNYNGVPQSTTTASSGTIGRAYSVYPGTGVAGSYSYYADFPGNAVYAANSSTAAITVTPRSVNLSAFPQTAILGSTASVTAEFRDGATNALVNGKTLKMVFQSSTVFTQTAGLGVASAVFNAPASTGVFNWLAEFAGDPVYAAASSTGTITVNRRAFTLTPVATTKYVWDSIFLSATFFDDGAPVSGKLLSFYFKGSTQTATTQASGMATTSVAFSSISTPGSNSFTVDFAGDAGYSAQSGSSTVTIVARPSNINAGPVSGIANSTVTLTATLLDTNWSTPVAGKTLVFTLQGATFTVSAVTDGSGVARAGYLASSSIGTYAYTATFAGNTNYAGSTNGNNLTVTLRPSVLEMADYNPPAGSTFTASAVLKDFTTGAAIPSKAVSFLFLGVTKAPLTDALGYASTSYVTLSSTSSYPISATFAGDALYAPAVINKTVFPGRRDTTLQTSDILNAVAKDTFTVTARLSDFGLGTYIAGSTITFSFSGSTYTLTALTNSTGTASVSFAAPASTGAYTYSASFPGDALYGSAVNTSAVTVNRRTLALTPGDVTSIPAASTFTVSALLADGALTISTKTLTFVFVATKTAVTNNIGVASTTFSAPSSTGTFIYKVTYPGDALYNPATSYANVGVILKPTVLEVLDVPDAVVGLKFTGTAKLRDVNLGELVTATKTISIVFGTVTVNSPTSVGVATASFNAPTSTGTYGYTATFAGDGVYGYSQSTGTITVNRRPVLFSLATDPNQPYAYRANAVQSSFTITGILSDGQVAGLNLAGQNITFVFQNSTQTVQTNAQGVAVVTYPSPVSSGTYAYYGYFYGDNSYNPNKPDDSVKSITIIQRPTNLLPRDSGTGVLNYDGQPNPFYTYWNYGLQARIIDTLSSQGIQGLTASFVLWNSTITGVSDSIGTAVSSATFGGVTNYGTYPAVVRFDGTGTYAPSILPGSTNTGDPYTAKVVVNRSPAYFDLPQITETFPDADTVISGNLLDWWNRPAVAYPGRFIGNPNAALIGYPITYKVSTIPCGADCAAVGRNWAITGTGVVGAGNIASATVHSPLAAGDYPISYSFPATNSFVQWDQVVTQRVLRVGRRVTFVFRDDGPVITVGALMPITIRATLGDLSNGGAGVSGKPLDVVLVTTQTLTTGSGGPVGSVKAVFPGMSVGTYTYTARFNEGDTAYMPSSSVGTIVVEKNTTILTADDVLNVPAGNSFTARAALGVVVGTSTLYGPGQTINFVFTSTGAPINLSAVTNALGIATVTFPSPYTPGGYNYTAELVEDANNKGSTDIANSVQVVKRRTAMLAQNGAVYILENFVSTGTLTDLDLGGAAIPGKTVNFTLHKVPDVNAPGVTSAAGLASATYLSPASSGPYQYVAVYPGDNLYALSSDTKTITVSRRVTAIDIVDITTPTNTTFWLSAKLTDVTKTSVSLSGLTVNFLFNGVTTPGVTGADGIATVSFVSPANSAIYPYSATFDGTQTYAPVTSNRTVNVRKRITAVSGTPVLVPAGSKFTAQATLIDVDGGGQQLPAYLISFVFTGTTTYNGSGITNEVGLATTSFTSPLSTGTYNFTASFAGDNTYGASSDPATDVVVNVASTTLSTPDGNAVVNNVFYATATLKGQASGVGVANKPVTFSYPGLNLGAAVMTDAEGVAVKSFSPPSTGTYRLDVNFAGDTAFFLSAGSATITVDRRLSGMTMPAIGTEVNALFIATATLRDLSVVPSTWVAGRTVDFLFQGTPRSGVTNSVGIATVSFTAPLLSGVYGATATFNGDAIYGSTTTSAPVVVAKYETQLTVASGTVTALEVFNATATLKVRGVAVPDKVIQFTYKGVTLPGLAVTNASGQAFVQFNAGASSGPWLLDANFNGAADPTYNTSPVSTNTITVTQRPCLVIPDNISLSVFDAFTATATFRDVANSTTPAGKFAKISFGWIGSTFTTTATDVAGKVYTSTTAPVSSGTYKVEAFYTGDATFAPSLASTATVTVTPRPTQLSVADVGTMIGRVFYATATLRNNTAFVDNRYVLFTFEGRPFNVKTGSGASSGIAVATYTVTLATGPTQISAVFNGDAAYYASSVATATVTAAMRPTSVSPVPASAIVDNPFIATASLIDIDLTTVAAKSLGFVFQGSTYTAQTNAVGVATVTIPASVSTGTFSMKVYFDGDFRYIASSATLTLTVGRRPTSMVPLSSVTVRALDVFFATATLKDMDLSTLGAKPVYFVFANSTFSRVTDGSGVAVSTYAAPASSGSYAVGAYFDGDARYANSSSTILVADLQRPSGINLNAVSVMAQDTFWSTATLTDLNNGALKVSTRPVTFTFSWGASTGGVTSGVGVATASYAATDIAGAYQLTGAFAGDGTYASTTTVMPLTVTRRSGFVTGVYVSTRVLDTFAVTGTFKDNVSSAAVAGRLINFYLEQGSTLTATTNGSGVASATFTAGASSGTYKLYTSCLGDSTYNATTVHVTTVTFARRDSYLALAAPAQVIINSSFTAAGTLYDSVSNSTVPSKGVSFLFQGSTRTFTTDALGSTSTVYTANTSSGAFALQVSFPGDATYNLSVATRAVTSLRYPTLLAASSITVTMNEVLTSTATLYDYRASTVPSKALLFTFQAAPFTSVTNSLGVAYSTFTTVGVASGTYTLPVTFAGDALYDSTSTSIPVLVNKRTPLLAAADVTVKALDVFTATATLSDLLNPAQKLNGQAVLFEFLVGTNTFTNSGTTDGSGIALSTFAAPVAGVYQVRATFAGNLTYYPKTSNGTVTVLARPAKLMQDNTAAAIDEVFRTTATLVDLATLQAVSTRTVTFTYAYGASSSSLTDAGGKASVAYTAPSSSGTSQLGSSFAGDSTYAAASSTGTLTINRRPVVLTPPAIAGVIDEVFTATVTVTDGLNASKVASRSVAFVFSNSTFTAATDLNGVAVSTFAAPPSSGTYYAAVNFAGDARFLPNGTTAQVIIDRRPSKVNPDVITARAAQVFTATATLTDVLNPGYKVAGRQLAFLFGGSTFTALTNANGVAVSTFLAPGSSGTARVDISFAGDSRYQVSAASAAVTVLRRMSVITFDPVTVKALDVFTATATLTDKVDPGVFANGRQLTFSFSGQDSGALTDAGGVAVSTFAGKASSGTYLVEASFAGDAVFDASYSSGSVIVIQRPVGLSMADGTAYPFESFTASGTLTDGAALTPVEGRSLVFGLDGVPAGGVTDAQGVAAAVYTPPGAFGDYELGGVFAGDATYAPASSTGTVSVKQRPTLLAALDANTVALEVFRATATLSDVRLSTAVEGQEVTFTFGSQTSTAATAADGYAYADFTAPVSSGVYSYQALFAGTSVYGVSAATGAVTVGTRFTRVIARDANANVGEPFILTAQVIDPARETLPGYNVSSGTVEFKFKDRNSLVIDTAYGTTNALGIATAAFSGPGAPDVYYYTATFLGNYTYSASSATAMVKVGLLTSLVAFNVETYALKSFNVNAKLTDYLSTTLDDKPVRFRFLGATATGLTYAGGVSGVAAAAFTAPASSGTYFYTAAFDGDPIYSASNSTATVTVVRRPTSLLAYAANTTAYSTFTLTTVLKDVLDPDMNVSGRDVYIAFNGSTATVNTAAGTGAASAQYVALSSGTYPYYAWFDGDDTFSGTLSTGTLTVTLMPTNMLSYNVTDVLAASTFTARVQVKDNANQPIKDLSVDFSFEGAFGMGTTNAQGIAEAVFAAPAASGTYTYDAEFYGDLRYAGSTASGNVTTGPRPTILVTPAASAKLGTQLELTARLIDVGRQAGLEGKTVSFVFAGATLTAQTDSLGVSTVSYASPASTGAYSYEATFTGDEITYTGSYSSAAVTIALNLTATEARSPITVKIYEPLDVYATVKDSIGLNLPGLPVVFSMRGIDLGGTTDEVGRATTTFLTTGFTSTGTYNYTAQYPGDSLYVASADTANVVNVLRRDTLLVAMDKQAAPNKPFTAEARLTDNVNGSALLGSALAGKTVVFWYFDGATTSSAAAVTSAAGVSSATFRAPGTTGSYLVSAEFADGDPVYLGFSSTGTLTVLLADGAGLMTTKIRAERVDTYITHVFTATATLTASEDPVPGKTLLFSFFNGLSTYTAAGLTDALGVATAAFTAPASSSALVYSAAFAGDLDYSATSGTATVTVSLYPDSLTAQDVSAYIGESFTARAVLRDELTQQFVAGKTVVFDFSDGVSTYTHHVSAVTSSTGAAEASFVTPLTPGNYSYLARFAGDAQYKEAMDIGSVLIASLGSSTFLVAYDVFVGTGEVFAASATLTSKGLPVPGKAVALTFGGLTAISTTNASGIAFSTFTAPASSGTYISSAAFAGDGLYNSALSTAAVSVVLRKLPDQPVFKVEVASAAVTLTWTPATKYQDQVTGYEVETAATLRPATDAGWNKQGFVSSTAPALGYTCPVDPDAATFLKVKTMLTDKQESGTTLIVEIPAKLADPERVPNYYYLSQDNNALVKIPGKMMDKLSGAAPFSVEIKEKTEPGFLRAYAISSTGLATDVASNINSGDRKGVKMSISYPRQTGPAPSAASGQMALYWNNGVEWIKLGGELDVQAGEVYTYARTFGQFAIKAAPLSSTFKLTKVFPRIFSPDADDATNTVNRATFAFENPGCGEVTIRIFDITGALVRRNIEATNCSVMFWNGKDQAGTAVKGGVYIYQIEAGENVITGTVVVAK